MGLAHSSQNPLRQVSFAHIAEHNPLCLSIVLCVVCYSVEQSGAVRVELLGIPLRNVLQHAIGFNNELII